MKFKIEDKVKPKIVEDKDCVKCELCDWLIAEPKELNNQKLCEQCYIGEIENPEHRLDCDYGRF